MFCPSCHTSNRENARFCKGCGQALFVEVSAHQQTVENVPSTPETASPAFDKTVQAESGQPPTVAASEAPTVYAPLPSSLEQDQATIYGEAPSLEQNQPAIYSAQPSLGQDQATIYGGAPSLEQNQPTIYSAQPSLGQDQATVYGGVPSLEQGQPTIYSAQPSLGQDQATVYGGVPSAAYDPALAPTQILTPAQVAAYRARHKQQGADEQSIKEEHQGGADQQARVDANTVSAPYSGDETYYQSSSVDDIANIPTIIIPVEAVSAQQSMDAQGSSTEQTPLVSEDNEGSTAASEDLSTHRTEAAKDAASQQEEEDSMEEQTPQPEKQKEGQKESLEWKEFPVLEVGASVNNRYEVTQIVKRDLSKHVYEVLDQKCYLHCWNCGSTENAEGDEFCVNCGAELGHVMYLLHEYPAIANAASQEDEVVPTNIIDTFIENGLTYLVEHLRSEQNDFPNGVRLLAACDSDAGNLRRSESNEDSAFILNFQRLHESVSSPAGIFLVADGLGGHSCGQDASRLAVSIVAERVVHDLLFSPLRAERENGSEKQWDGEALTDLLRGAIEAANTAICRVNQDKKSDMGCTLTGFMIVGDHAFVFNVGDSRTYMLRDGKIYQLTHDHSLVGQLVAGGLIEPEDVYTHPQRSQIFRSIGDKLNVQIDLFEQQIHPGDILLSCSDGLWEMVRDPQITEILNAAPDPQTACSQLIEAANVNGGEDNISAVVVCVR
jgi:serine/threonine protein phosphatase PrpC